MGKSLGKGIAIGVAIGIVILIGVLVLFYYIGSKDTPDKTSLKELPLPEDMTSINSMTENILQSLNNNDYAGFSKDFSDTLKNTITAHVFLSLHDLISQTSGKYLSKSTPKLYKTEELGVSYEVYDYPGEFEKESVFVAVSTNPDSGKVEGILFDSEKLREATSK